MLRYTAFALGTTMALGLPQISAAQTLGPVVQPPVVGVVQPVVAVRQPAVAVRQPVVGVVQPVVAVRQPVALVSEPVIAVDRVTEEFDRLPIAGSARDDSECYSPETDGPSNTRALPLCLDYLQRADGGDQYDTLDRVNLADTRICSAGVNCGPPADLTNIRPFYGSAGAPAPQPVVAQPVVVARAPVVLTPPPAPAPVLMPPPAPVPVALPSTGFGGAGLALAGAAGLAAIVGIIAIASDDDDDSTVSTVGTR